MNDPVKSSFQTLIDLGLLQSSPRPTSPKPIASKPPLALKPTPVPRDDTSSIDLNDTQQSKCSSIKEELKELLENDTRLKEICREIKGRKKGESKQEVVKRVLTPSKAAKLGKLLYERGQEMVNSRNQHAQAIFDREHPFKPRIDPNSSRLLEHSEAVRKPLYSPRVVLEDSVSTQAEETKQTLTPGMLKKFIRRNYDTQIEKRKGRLSQAEEKEKRVDQECTFTPRLNENSVELATPVLFTQRSKMSLYAQAMDHIQRRRERSESAKRAREVFEVKECTFTPAISSNQATPRKVPMAEAEAERVRGRKTPVDIREALRTVELLSKRLVK